MVIGKGNEQRSQERSNDIGFEHHNEQRENGNTHYRRREHRCADVLRSSDITDRRLTTQFDDEDQRRDRRWGRAFEHENTRNCWVVESEHDSHSETDKRCNEELDRKSVV